jgi:protein-disulfide isomerase
MMRRVRAAMVRACVVVAVALTAAACGGNSADTTLVGPGTTSALPALSVMLADKVLGNANAAVSLIEYSSLTCPHCASFHASTLPQIKAAYIDTGKVKLIYRDFPLDTNGLSAAMVARCSGDRYFIVLELLFQSQSSWSGAANPTSAFKSIVAPTGMSGADVDACLALTDLRNGITNIKTGGQQLGVSGTPTFIAGGQTIVGAMPYATFDALLKPLVQ